MLFYIKNGINVAPLLVHKKGQTVGHLLLYCPGCGAALFVESHGTQKHEGCFTSSATNRVTASTGDPGVNGGHSVLLGHFGGRKLDLVINNLLYIKCSCQLPKSTY